MNYIDPFWRCPTALCPARIGLLLLQELRDHTRALEPTWRHTWPPSLATLRILTPDGLLPNTWEERFCKILQMPSVTHGDHLIPRTAAALIAARKKALTTVSGKQCKVSTWNVNGMSPAGTLQNCEKLRQVRSLTKDTIVVLTETKWVEGDHTRVMQLYGGTFIGQAPAVTTEAAGKSGGVAIIVPTLQWGKNIKTEVIVHGYALALTISNR